MPQSPQNRAQHRPREKKHVANHSAPRGISSEEIGAMEYDAIKEKLSAFLQEFGLDANHKVTLPQAGGGTLHGPLGEAFLEGVSQLKDAMKSRKKGRVDAAHELQEVIEAALPPSRHAEAFTALHEIASDIARNARGSVHL